LNLSDNNEVAKWCLENQISLVVVGPEAPLAEGLSDVLQSNNISCFGPSKSAAQIESSKSFAKAFMDEYDIPTAKWMAFDNVTDACKHIETANYNALVIKADGLAAGKGVVVADDKEQAINSVKMMIENKKFGDAGNVVVVEEKLTGEEISVLCFSDGTTVASFPPAQDYKRLNADLDAPNTGGMGSYCPVKRIPSHTCRFIEENILQKTISGLKERGYPFVGILYAGLMITDEGPKVLEFNCRFGDPETQVLLPMLKSNLYDVMMACVTGDLKSNMPDFHKDMSAVTVVLASGGYPGSYKKGIPINGLEDFKNLDGIKVFHAGTSEKDGTIVTSGGRVLGATGFGKTIAEARNKAYRAAYGISFDGMYFRKDIAGSMPAIKRSVSYFSSGVDIDTGLSLVEAFRPLAGATARVGCNPDLGGFGGVFDLKACGYKDALLVSGTDGVGTKLKVAQESGIHNTVGIDLVAMSVNDILAQGAEPLYFLDYFASGKLSPGIVKHVITGIAQGCALSRCALIGGETAEMPGMYQGGEYDLAGFAVGAVERNRLLPKVDDIVPGDSIIGIASSGVHSNGFSLVRCIVELSHTKYSDRCPFSNDEQTFGEELLTPTKIYVKSVLPLLKKGKVKACAHITGGGLIDNLPRVLPRSASAHLDATKWTIPPIFKWLAKHGNVEAKEMLRTFNCGVGFVLITSSKDVRDVLLSLEQAGETAWNIGIVEKKSGSHEQVKVEGFISALEGFEDYDVINVDEVSHSKRLRVGVLISGSGTNLQALIDQSLKPESKAEIRLVISNVPGVKGIERAESAGIKTKVINHKVFPSRVSFDRAVSAALEEEGIELVCLAGFMRILSGEFVQKWRGRLLNVHPSLLPSFKGMNAHEQVLESGVRLTGCTVHFVEEEVDAGGIIVQESVPVLLDDTTESLQERVKTVEHKAFPKAMELIASGKVRLGANGKVEWL